MYNLQHVMVYICKREAYRYNFIFNLDLAISDETQPLVISLESGLIFMKCAHYWFFQKI